VISTELEEELVGEGFDGVAHDEGVVADELAAQFHEPGGGGEAESVAGEVGSGVVGAVVVEQGCACLVGASPGVEAGAVGGGGEVVVDLIRERCAVAWVGGLGDDAGVVDADGAVGEGSVHLFGELVAQG
jgi:hypothetical protein